MDTQTARDRIMRRARVARRRRAFTLVELLAVIAIMAILVVAALPALRNLGHQGVQTAIPSLTSTLRLARQYAVTHRQYVYVVFPSYDAGIPAPSYAGCPTEVTKALRAYAVIAGDQTTTLPSQYITDWKYLPEGIYFDYRGAPIVSGNNVLLGYDSGAACNIYPFPSSTDPVSRMPAIQFRPNGKVYWYVAGTGWQTLASPVHIALAAGIVNANTNNGTVSSVEYFAARSNYIIRVDRMTGMVDVKRN